MAGRINGMHRAFYRCAQHLRAYGAFISARKGLILAMAVFTFTSGAVAQARTLTVVALGDSLTAGFGLPKADSFASKLEVALKAKGYDVVIINAGVSGDTTSGGLARLGWSVPKEADAVILELGANDMLRGTDPEVTRKALSEILTRLQQRGLPVLLAGMRAAPNLGADYQARFDKVFPDLARAYPVIYYPFFLEGVAGDRRLNQPDGLHPTAAGVDRIVSGILPDVEKLLARAKEKPPTQ